MKQGMRWWAGSALVCMALAGCGGADEATAPSDEPGDGAAADDRGDAKLEPAPDGGARDAAIEDGRASDDADHDTAPADASEEAPLAADAADAAKDPGIDLGAPIVVDPADDEKWVWVPIDEMRCADDSPAGVAVNFTKKSRRLLIHFQGNGVCYDLKSCTMFQTALVGMGPDPIDHLFWGDKNAPHTGIFDRTDPANPFRDDNFVALPHCTIDGHSADKTSTYPPLKTYHQHGYRNATEALQRVVPTFEDATRVVVSGFSAGGIGAMANYHKIATAFEAVAGQLPFLIDDGGPLLREPYLSDVANDSVRKGWGLTQTIEPWCPDCATEGFGAVYRTLAELHPGLRNSLVCAYSDTVVTGLYGMMTYDLRYAGTRLKEGLLDFASYTEAYQAAVAPSVQREFYYVSNRHGAIVAPWAATPGLSDFLQAQLDGSAGWASVIP